jgi:membrane-bound metal-dependent hydrolase YbcI (DUF457 family)
MKRRTHIALGMLSAGVTILILIAIGMETELPLGDLMLIGGIFGILPDIDIFIKKHRNGFTHSIFTSILVFFIILILSIIEYEGIFSSFFSWDSALIASIAIFSHTIADSLTSWGVPLYYPFSRRKHVHFPFIGGRLRYDNSFANIAIEISSIFLLIVIVASGIFTGLDSSPENSIKLVRDIISYF